MNSGNNTAPVQFLNTQFQALANFFSDAAPLFFTEEMLRPIEEQVTEGVQEYRQLQFMQQVLGMAKDADPRAFKRALDQSTYLARPPAVQQFLDQVEQAIASPSTLAQWLQHQHALLDQQIFLAGRKAQREQALLQLQTPPADYQKNLESLPWRTQISPVRDSYRQYLAGTHPVPLLVILSPPQVASDRAGNLSESFRQLEGDLTEKLRQFLGQNYPRTDGDRPTEFLGGGTEGKPLYGETATKLLYWMLRAVPTLVLESEVSGDYLNFRVGFWGMGQSSYRYNSVLSRLPYRVLLNEFAKSRALAWKGDRDKYLTLGKSPKQLLDLGGVDEENLLIYEEEQETKRLGINRPRNYIIQDEHVADFGNFLVLCHQLLIAWIADAYFLSQNRQTAPQLVTLVAELTDGLPPAVVETLTQGVITAYQKLYRTLARVIPTQTAQITLDLAESLVHLPQSRWATAQLQESLQAWGKERNLSGADPLSALEGHLRPEDQPYLESLQALLLQLNDPGQLALVQRYLGQLRQQKNRQSEQEAQLRRHETALTLSFYKCASAVNTLAFSPNGQYLASDEDRLIKLLHVPSREVVQILEGHTDAIQAVAFHPNGKMLASASNDRTLRLWDLSTGQANVLQGHTGWVMTVAISPDGQFLASGGGDMAIRLWNGNTGQPIRMFQVHVEAVQALAFSPDSQVLAAGSYDTTVSLANLRNGRMNRLRVGYSIYSLAFSPDGKILAAGTSDQAASLWDASTGEFIRLLEGHRGVVYSITFSPDGQTILTGGADDTIRLWNTATGKLLHTFEGHTGPVYSVTFSPDNQTLASGSYDNSIGMVFLGTDYLQDVFAPLSRQPSAKS